MGTSGKQVNLQQAIASGAPDHRIIQNSFLAAGRAFADNRDRVGLGILQQRVDQTALRSRRFAMNHS
ncbi:hypothetical protein D3C81_1935330 [compost metagenome]